MIFLFIFLDVTLFETKFKVKKYIYSSLNNYYYMFKYFLVLFCVLSTFNSTYLPFKKNKDFPDDACTYSYKDNLYVKDCGNGKYCKDRGDNLSKCENLPSVELSSLDGACTSDFECENNLVCTNSKCSYFYNTDCSSSQTKVTTQNRYECRDTETLNIWYTKDFTWQDDASEPKKGYLKNPNPVSIHYEPDTLKVRGKITEWNITSDSNGKIYEPTKIIHSDIGTVEDGEFVYDELACKSGFALFFYGDGKLTNPYDSSDYNYMYKKCVTLEAIEKLPSRCKIKYNLDGKSLSYNVNKIESTAKTILYTQSGPNNNNEYYGTFRSYSDYFYNINHNSDNHSENTLCNENIKIKVDIFQKYVGSLTDEIRKCTNPEKNNPLTLETCQNNQLRKWAYFYDNPDNYVLYYTEKEEGKKVVNYLVQSEIPSYQSSSFLNLKYYICLLLLISLI